MKVIVVDELPCESEKLFFLKEFLKAGNTVVSIRSCETPALERCVVWLLHEKGIDGHFISMQFPYGNPILYTKKHPQCCGNYELVEEYISSIAYDPLFSDDFLMVTLQTIKCVCPEVLWNDIIWNSNLPMITSRVISCQGALLQEKNSENWLSKIDELLSRTSYARDISLPISNRFYMRNQNPFVLFASLEGVIDDDYTFFRCCPNKKENALALKKYLEDGNLLVILSTCNGTPEADYKQIHWLLKDAEKAISHNVFIIKQGVTPFLYGSLNRFSNAVIPPSLQHVFGYEKVCHFPFTWYEDKTEVIEPFLDVLRENQIIPKGIFGIGGNPFYDLPFIRKIEQLEGKGGLVITDARPVTLLFKKYQESNYDETVLPIFIQTTNHIVRDLASFLRLYGLITDDHVKQLKK